MCAKGVKTVFDCCNGEFVLFIVEIIEFCRERVIMICG